MKEVGATSEGKRSLRGKHLESYNETKLAAKSTQQICTQPKVLVQPKKEKKEETKKTYVQEVDPLRPYELITLDIQGEEDIQCDICLEFEYEDGDLIVICDLCNAATH
jgi:hypothetical protein